ncbi:MAG: endolytic transglycosylase MltG [Candidatus Eisenbacteria bacterium]
MRVLIRDGLAMGVLTAVCLVTTGIFSQAGFHEPRHVYVVIDRGISFSEIGERFQSSGLIKDGLVFLVLGRVFGIEHRAKAGRYRFAGASNMIDILHTLYKGATYREKVLVRPGRTIEVVGGILGEKAAIDSVSFVSLCYDSTFVRGLGVPSITAEGYLFPDTYDIEWQEDAESVMRRMVSGFFRVFDDSLHARAGQMGMTVNEAVTLASIIEREAMLDEERPKISAVFHNRLRRGMRLQADPTVRYALKKWRGRVLYEDLKFDSPYNTYRVYGLPPRPICNPGLASMIAALNPIPGSDDLYFVAQGDGSHYFSTNSGEHLQAKGRYKSYLKAVETKRMKTAEVARQDSITRAETAGDPGSPKKPEGMKETIHLKDGPGGAR